MDLLNTYQKRMDKCTREQFWAVALYASMSGFILLNRSLMAETINRTLLIIGIVLSGMLCIGYIVSRHRIYAYYDSLANEIIIKEARKMKISAPEVQGRNKRLALLSGVLFYTCIIAIMLYVAVMAVVAQ